MLLRLALSAFDLSAAQEADRLIRNCGAGALEMARHAVRASGERSRAEFWTRVLAQVERRSIYRPW